MERFLAETPKGSVVIATDRDSRIGLVIQVLDACRLAGIKNVSVAARKLDSIASSSEVFSIVLFIQRESGSNRGFSSAETKDPALARFFSETNGRFWPKAAGHIAELLLVADTRCSSYSASNSAQICRAQSRICRDSSHRSDSSY